MKKPKAKIIVSRYKEDYNWVKEYTDDYLVYNKGYPIFEKNIINTPNLGGNQRDIFKYIFENYNNLPELMAFVQAEPFDHCEKDIFDKKIYNTVFTCLETPSPFTSGRKEYNSMYYMEPNVANRFLGGTYKTLEGYNQGITSVDMFMEKYFSNYEHLNVIRFTPGSQYIIERRQALKYPKALYKNMMNEMNYRSSVISHIVERCIYIIFTNEYIVNEQFIKE